MTSSHLMGLLMITKQRKINEKLKRREDILEAAKEVFFSKGLELATMEEIANKAQLSKGTLYLYFKSKEELYISLIEKGGKFFSEYFQNAKSPELSAHEQTLNLIDAFYRFYTEHRQYYKILFTIQSGGIDRNKISDHVYEKIYKQASDLLVFIVNIIRKGKSTGEFVNVDPMNAALSFWALATGVFSVSDYMQRNKLGLIKDKALLDFAANMLMSQLKANRMQSDKGNQVAHLNTKISNNKKKSVKARKV